MADEKRRKSLGIHETAEAVFKPAPIKAAEPVKEPRAIPGAREMVSLRIDQDVLAYFQEQGPGWQERLNETLRKAVGL